MRIRFLLQLLAIVCITTSLHSQSRWAPENRPGGESKRMFISVDAFPSLVLGGYGIDYTWAASPVFGHRLRYISAGILSDESDYDSQWNTGTKPSDVTGYLEMSYGMYYNLKGEDLGEPFVGLSVGFMMASKKAWEIDEFNERYTSVVQSATGLAISPTIGTRYFFGPLGISGEIGLSIKAGDGEGTGELFFSGESVTPIIRTQIGIAL